MIKLTQNIMIGILVLVAIISLYVNNVLAATSATVTATVTAQNISVSVSDGTVTYGTLSLSAAEDTTSSGLNDSQIATNDGNITEDINIRGQDSANWTLAADTGPDNYRHRFCNSNCDGGPSWTALTTSNQTLTASVAAGETAPHFDLEIGIPTTSSNYTQQSVDVIVQAAAP